MVIINIAVMVGKINYILKPKSQHYKNKKNTQIFNLSIYMILSVLVEATIYL
jgi:hypothetical protein